MTDIHQMTCFPLTYYAILSCQIAAQLFKFIVTFFPQCTHYKMSLESFFTFIKYYMSCSFVVCHIFICIFTCFCTSASLKAILLLFFYIFHLHTQRIQWIWRTILAAFTRLFLKYCTNICLVYYLVDITLQLLR